ncbi:TraU family protein [Acinetobacter baumannii]|uniref:TraU family protein n=1 Tax=Acinetobacter baumannii TaxID=470 RepID=UPI0035266905
MSCLGILISRSSLTSQTHLHKLACAGDCVLASAGFGSNGLFWCAGCNGSIYPLNGNVGAHVSLYSSFIN